MTKHFLAALGIGLLFYHGTFANVVDTFDFSDANHAGSLGNSDNTVSTRPTSIGPAGYTIGEIHWSGHASPVPADSQTYGSELMLRITHNAVPYDIQLGTGKYYSEGTPFSGSTYLLALAGLSVAQNDSFTFEFYDTYDDNAGVDATWNDLTIDFTDEIPPIIDPVAAGFIRIDTTGSSSLNTNPGGAGENYWGIEYGADTGGLPAIESIEIIMAEDVRAADIVFDPYYPDGTFVANTLNGITSANASFSHVDEDNPTRYGRMLLEFQSGDFMPGDLIRFGIAINESDRWEDPDYAVNGYDIHLSDPPIKIIIHFEDETQSIGYLTGIASTASPNISLFSYVDIPVIPVSFNPADFNEDTMVDSDDLTLWSTGFGKESGALHGDGDADEDGDVDGTDFLIWQQNYGFGTTGSGLSATAIPEPASWILFALATAAMVPWRRFMAACALVLLCASIGSASVYDTILLADAPSNDEQWSSVNHVETYLSQATSAYTLGEIRWSGMAQAVEDTTAGVGDDRFPSWGNELYARITHEDTSLNATTFDIPLGSGGWFWQAPVAFSGFIPHLAGLVVNPSDKFTIELYESVDDIEADGGYTDAIWSTLAFELTDENPAPPITAPVAEGYVRFSTAGYNTHSYDSNAIEYWRVEYGPDASGNLPAIESITIDVGDPDVVSFDPTDPSGDLVYYYDDGYQRGLSDPDITNADVDEPASLFDLAFGQFIFTFKTGAFAPGDEFRFGSDLDGAPKDGSLLRTLETPIELRITFEGGAEATAYLTELGYTGPGEFQFSYGDVAVPIHGSGTAAVPEPATLFLLGLSLLAWLPFPRRR
ncbi:MAG: PEP-CTERM sorting domain-containing protein [Pirellulales bacterium]|nr:PEP-CTERM sorting domain-containing protein [Pirellulales bacterium]